jgi:hypothetical protein
MNFLFLGAFHMNHAGLVLRLPGVKISIETSNGFIDIARAVPILRGHPARFPNDRPVKVLP